MSWSKYPIGTKAYASTGGYWERVERGWKWCTGSTFPTPGGDVIRIEPPCKQIDHANGENMTINKFKQEIIWTNCAEQMPPDDEAMIICTYADGMIDKMHAMIFHVAVKLSRKANGETYIAWTPYTPEKWKELNK